MSQRNSVASRSSGHLQPVTPVRHSFSGRDFQRPEGSEFILDRDYAMDEMDALLPLVGVGFNRGVLDKVVDFAMDTIAQPNLPSTAAVPLQFLQNWLPGIVELVTAKQTIDEILGRQTVGDWADAQVVQPVVQLTGAARPYADLANVPYSSWNPAFVTRDVVRFELGLFVGPLEEAQSAKMRFDSASLKRRSDAINLEIQRNRLGFYGYNNGLGRTFGFLNEPNLPAYITAPNGNWPTATFQQIRQDLVTLFALLRTSSKGRIDPRKDAITIVLPTSRIDYLSTVTDFGMSVLEWLEKFYPNVRIIDAPELDGANGGQNVMYMYADKVKDSGTDDQSTWAQLVAATFQLIGAQKMTKGYEEDYSNASAGALLKRPYAVKRMTGI